MLDPLKDPHICGRPQCNLEKTNFNYSSNIRYRYDYTSHVRSEFNGTGQNSSNIYVTGTVVLTFPQKCEGLLKILDIELRERPIEDDAQIESSNDYSSSDGTHKKSLDFAHDVQKYDLR